MRHAWLVALALCVASCRSPCPGVPSPYDFFCQNSGEGFDECYAKCTGAGLPKDRCFEQCSTSEPKPRPQMLDAPPGLKTQASGGGRPHGP